MSIALSILLLIVDQKPTIYSTIHTNVDCTTNSYIESELPIILSSVDN